ncbi:MAG: biotin--[acetyl-CoA-carboxylase] ligase [Muribaculaceae bacterium]|nr:biotin--[acetyl-CoA-carboxylase] ligase [Muribaculaceae bacterium]
MKIIRLDSTDSTNAWLKRRVGEDDSECLVYAREQTAGRGQRGNSWESEPGQNLTASALLHPEGIEPSRQFIVSEAVALAVTDVLRGLGIKAMVKWPNDIYVADQKICGILIEHAIMSRSILHTVAGIGLNLNQRQFLSDAPNPVSASQITGMAYDVDRMAIILADTLKERLKEAISAPEALHTEFISALWRGDGNMYPFLDVSSGEQFKGRISGIAPDGILTLEDSDGSLRQYAFKEVSFIL